MLKGERIGDCRLCLTKRDDSGLLYIDFFSVQGVRTDVLANDRRSRNHGTVDDVGKVEVR